MTTYVLDGTASAALPRRPLAIRLTTVGGATGARLVIRSDSDAPTRIIQQSDGLVIVPRVDAGITVLAEPAHGRTSFDPGTLLHVTFGPDSDLDDATADIAQLTPRDVSGMSILELATVRPGPTGTITVETRLAVPDAALPPLAAQARIACRRVLRTDHLTAAEQVDLECVVDTSASMARLFSTGSVAACGEIVGGIAAVIAPGQEITVRLDGQSTTVIGADRIGELLATTPAAGFGLMGSDVHSTPSPNNRRTTIFITDGPNAPQNNPSSSVAALVLSNSSAAARRDGFVGAICPVGDTPAELQSRLVNNPDELAQIVSALLAPTTLGSGAR